MFYEGPCDSTYKFSIFSKRNKPTFRIGSLVDDVINSDLKNIKFIFYYISDYRVLF